ncbi:MAG: hypothetical protein GF317_12200 [Candidatus Lokiarchaeota archaeon]|nr:hypothetical protein [Candidatus Lokiarchaeota archaeon]MBD3200409.1 hypothetical protein [Candidatus Lokiarchaeota archaeon]
MAKYNSKQSIKLFLILVISVSLIGLFLLADSIVIENYSNAQKSRVKSLNDSGFWSLTEPIFIDGDASGVDAHNWSWVESQVWFGGGNGSTLDPYHIENITIIGESTENCIHIVDSNVHFIVRNCTLIGPYSSPSIGIYLENVESALIESNFISEFNYGCHLVNVNSSHLDGNRIMNNSANSFRIQDSNYNNISNNIANHNTGNGFSLSNVFHSTFYNNTAFYNTGGPTSSGIYITFESDFNNFIENTLSDNSRGMMINPDSNGNVFDSNIITHNAQIGIGCYGVYNNTFRNNYFFDNDNHGISFDSGSRFNRIINNELIEQSGSAISFVYNSSYNIAKNNTLIKNGVGFFIYTLAQGPCKYNKIINNRIWNSTSRGMRLWGANYLICKNDILNNEIKFTEGSGIYATMNVSDNNISNNSITFNEFGIVFDDINGSNNEIRDNYISCNQKGIILEDSGENIVSKNRIAFNTEFGVKMDCVVASRDENIISENLFIKNTKHAIDVYENNYWNSSIIGNYWSNYTGEDIAPVDGIGDSPHNLTEGIDYLPIFNGAPKIMIISPINESKVSAPPPEFSVSVIDTNLLKTWYTIDGGLTNITYTSNGTFNSVLWNLLVSNLTDGDQINITFYASDDYNHTSSQSIVVIFSDPLLIPIPGIPGYEIWIVLGSLFMGIGLISSYRKRKLII